jgi:O-antigen/teichoic acid export membrane protein
VSDSGTLDRALLSGIAWTAALRWSSQVVSWVATIFVARMLLPGDYGLVSMATIPIGLVRMIEDFGLDAILIQDRTIVDRRQAQLAGFILGIGGVLSVLSLALSHPIALFFKEPQVAQIIAVMSLLFLTDALQVVPRAILQRRLAFAHLALAFFLQVLVMQSVLVAGALAGWGFWALVVSNVTAAIVITVLLYWWAPYVIHWPRHLKQLAQPLAQGWRVMASRFAYYAYATSDQTIVGRFLGKDALGAYSFALTFVNLPFQEASSIVTKVVPGIFSEVQTRRDELRRYFLMLTECLAYITLPMAVGLAITADLAVDVVLGPNWSEVVLPLRVMCVFAAFQGLQILISPLLMWTGQFRAQMWCSIVTGIALPLGFLAAVNYGLVAIAAVWAVVYPLSNIPALRFGLRTVSVSFLGWLETARPAAVGCLVMALGVLAARWLTADRSDVVQLGAAVGTGALSYTAVIWLFYRARVLALVEFVKKGRARPAPDRLEPTAELSA